MILPYNIRFYVVFLNKTKVVPLRFFSKSDFLNPFCEHQFWKKIYILRKNVRVLPWFQLKKHHTIGYYRVKSVSAVII